jgi:hypothetical protein
LLGRLLRARAPAALLGDGTAQQRLVWNRLSSRLVAKSPRALTSRASRSRLSSAYPAYPRLCSPTSPRAVTARASHSRMRSGLRALSWRRRPAAAPREAELLDGRRRWEQRRARAPVTRGGAARGRGRPSRRAQRSSTARAAAARPRHVVRRGARLGDKKDITVKASGSGMRRISRSRSGASRQCMGPFEAFDSAVGQRRSERAAQTTKVARGR